jgi:hypothetical protein
MSFLEGIYPLKRLALASSSAVYVQNENLPLLENNSIYPPQLMLYIHG